MKRQINRQNPDIPAAIQIALKKFEKEYNNQLRMDSPLLNPVFKHVLGARGKRIRPLLFFLFQSIYNKTAKHNEIIPVILEMLHEASLIHDDVIDASLTRRGRASMNAKFSNKVSVLCGDYLMAKVLDLGINVKLDGMMEIISRTAVNMGLGELRQAVSKPKDSALEPAYFQTVNDKTAGLSAAACELGCLAGGAEGDTLTHAAQFGRLYGTIFQIRDDILDFTGSSKSMGKPVGQDLADGKVTLPLILAMKKSPRAEKQKIYQLLERRAETDCTWLRSFVMSHDGIELAHKHERKIADEGLEQLEYFPDCEFRQILHNMISLDLERQK